MKTTSSVLKRGPAKFDMVGQFLGYDLKDTSESITPGLQKRLLRYAERELTELGLLPMPKCMRCEVYTLDGDEPPSERSYGVRFITGAGAYIGVQGILTRKGWPTLDHGLDIGDRA